MALATTAVNSITMYASSMSLSLLVISPNSNLGAAAVPPLVAVLAVMPKVGAAVAARKSVPITKVF